jgi:hypothetical protein
MKTTCWLLCLVLSASAEEPGTWTAKDSHLLRNGQPRLFLAVSDLEPVHERLVCYREGGLDAVWVRSLLNDTPEGIAETLAVAQRASIPLVGGLPIANLRHLEPGRILQYASSQAVAAWELSSEDQAVLEAALKADPAKLFLVPTASGKRLPDRVAAWGYLSRPQAAPPEAGPRVARVGARQITETTVLQCLACLAAGADGLILSGSHDGLPPDQAGLDWMRPRVALLREFHATLLARPASWQTVQTPT